MKKHFLISISAIFLFGCSGSAYHLPQVTAADMQQMESKLAASGSTTKRYKRSDKENKQILASATKRLIKNATPLCEHAAYESCHFEVSYNVGGEVNAYASEGYKITVYRGMMEHLKTHDEVAAVIAHEMGHHLANHNEEKYQNAVTGAAVSGILTAVLLGAASANAPYNAYQQQQNQQTIENMMNAGAGLGALSYSKEQEREADLLATYLLSRAGYNLKKAQNVMVVLANLSGRNTAANRSAFLDTHPAGIERVVAWEKAIDEVKGNKSKLPYLKETSGQQHNKPQSNIKSK